MQMDNLVKVFLISGLIAMVLISCTSNGIEKEKSALSNNKAMEILGRTSEEWDKKLEAIKFADKYPDYYCEYSNDEIFEGIIIANYDTKKITPLDERQEVFEYGNLYGELDSDKYLQISILDEDNSYSVNVNCETGELTDEDGEFFLDTDKEEYIKDKVNMIKEIIE